MLQSTQNIQIIQTMECRKGKNEKKPERKLRKEIDKGDKYRN